MPNLIRTILLGEEIPRPLCSEIEEVGEEEEKKKNVVNIDEKMQNIGNEGAFTCNPHGAATPHGPSLPGPLRPAYRPSSEILGGFDKLFRKYKWYMQSHFIRDSRQPQRLMGFGFMVGDCPEVDKEFEASHCLNEKQVSVSRTISVSTLPETVGKDDLMGFFSKYGKVLECEIISGTGLGIVIFDTKESVDAVFREPNLFLHNSKVEVRKAHIRGSWMPPPPATGWRGVKEKILSMIGLQPEDII